ncbi:VanW family protein [Variovorax sp. CY25R-8]|uniref:VanW family protein n=1 Tax=Variovorax sp. CY25R-8 TaxID=2855501 RepID=UPI0021BB0889|nr:VanW family protein [Variovorax sp. CY25R-8]
MSVQAWQPPRRIDAIDFWLRSRLLVIAHGLRETWRPSARRWPMADALADAPVLARFSSPLWTDGRDDEFALVAGKVQNLRVARAAFDAIEVPAGELLSFWRQLGRPSAWRGFVQGRELRGGCVVPTLAGGLCQLSNALATVGARAGLELVERHAHTARIEQAAAGPDDAVDATVFWNYVDLKLRARHAWRLEVEITATELVLRIRAHAPPVAPRVMWRAPRDAGADALAPPVARGCLSCDRNDCFRHRPALPVAAQGRTAVLLDAWTPEFARYLEARHPEADRMQRAPVRLAFWRPMRDWRGGEASVHRPWLASVRGALWRRLWARREGGRRQAGVIDAQRWLARAFAARLRPEHTQLVVDQALLPHLQRLGALDGRAFTVLAGALPMAEIEARLDAAAARWPDDTTLRDFRAAPSLVRAEAQAFARAATVVTPHAAVADVMATAAPQATLERLEWVLPGMSPRANRTPDDGAPLVVLPASALARKGARELAAALRGSGWRLRVLGSPSADASLWQGIALDAARDPRGDWLDGARVVVLPAHVEHAPRAALRALAAGVPVVASTACGLAGRQGVREVRAGDIEGLRAALREAIDGQCHSNEQDDNDQRFP